MIIWVWFMSDDFIFPKSYFTDGGGQNILHGVVSNKAEQNKREIPINCTYPSTVLQSD